MQLRVITFNIHKGLNLGSNRLVLHRVKELLTAIDADIVFLQEVQGEHKKRSQQFADWSKLPQTEYLAAGTWPYHCYGKTHCHQHGHHGNALLSKYPLLGTMNVDISPHRISNRGLLYAKLTLPNDDLSIHLICTHFGLLKIERSKQFALLNEFIHTKIHADEPLLIAGDFNDWRSASLDLLNKSLGLCEVFNMVHGEYAKSFPASLPLLKVDRIYYRNLVPQYCEIIKTHKLSDHLPLLAKFSLNKND